MAPHSAMTHPTLADTIAVSQGADGASSPKKRKSKSAHAASPSPLTNIPRIDPTDSTRPRTRRNSITSYYESEGSDLEDQDISPSRGDDDGKQSAQNGSLSHKAARLRRGSKRTKISGRATIPKRALHDDFDEDTESSLEESDSDHSLFEDEEGQDNHSPFDDEESEQDIGFESTHDDDQEDEIEDDILQGTKNHLGGTTQSKGTNKGQVLAAGQQDKKYKCVYPGCDKSYTKPSRLAEHERAHTGERPFICHEPGCNAAFRRESHFAVHWLSHGSTKAYGCPQPGCEKSFYTEDKLIRHLVVHDNEIAKQFPDSDHAEEIIKRKPYVCTWGGGCFKRFTKHQKLKAHVCMVHEGRKPYPCTHEDCSKSFQTPSKLRKHQMTHSQEKRYACGAEGCGAFFSKWSQLQQHTKMDHKSVPCAICGKRVLKRNMGSHLKVHDSSRPEVPCQHEGCTKVFSTERTLAAHLKKAHAEAEIKEMQFPCEFDGCAKSFEYRHVLERHFNRIHVNPTPQRKKRSDALNLSAVDLLFGLTEEDAKIKLPFVCPVPDCGARYSRQHLLDRHLTSRVHTEDELSIQFLEKMEDMEEATRLYEEQDIRNIIDVNFEGPSSSQAPTTADEDQIGNV